MKAAEEVEFADKCDIRLYQAFNLLTIRTFQWLKTTDIE
jgi:hypothetical protein